MFITVKIAFIFRAFWLQGATSVITKCELTNKAEFFIIYNFIMIMEMTSSTFQT